jgi:hypothetical protein
LYGGGDYSMIGYEVIFNEPKGEVQCFILEGLQINGKFADASVIIKIKGAYRIHSNLMISYNPSTTREENIRVVIDTLQEKIEKTTTR